MAQNTHIEPSAPQPQFREKVLPGFEPRSLDSKSRVLTTTPQNQALKFDSTKDIYSQYLVILFCILKLQFKVVVSNGCRAFFSGGGEGCLWAPFNVWQTNKEGAYPFEFMGKK